MKKITLLKITTVLLCFFSFHTGLYSQAFEWAKRAGYYEFDYGYGNAVDAAGNIYVAGKYEQTGAEFGDKKLVCAGNHDMFIAKYDPTGNLVWIHTGGGVWGDYAHDVAADAAGNSYAVGEFEVTADFEGTSLTTNGGNDGFIAKYNASGQMQWLKKAGGQNEDQLLAVAVSGNHIYVTGKFQGVATFDNVTLTCKGGTNKDGDDTFVAKYDASNGNLVWIKQIGGAGEEEGFGITADNAGNVYVTGYFQQTVDFSGASLTSIGQSDIFFAKYDANGTLQWAKRAGCKNDNDEGYGVAADNNGKVYFTGIFRQDSDFDNITIWGNLGDADIFIACYNAATGAAEWVKKAGGDINDFAFDIALDNASNIYITGAFGNTATFDTKTVVSPDSTDIYVASYTPSGSLRWILQATGSKDKSYTGGTYEAGQSLCVDPLGNIAVTGAFRTDAVFGNTTIQGFEHTDIFITKINPALSGIEEENAFSLIGNMNIYPNPTNGIITVEINKPSQKQEILEVEVSNLLGQVMYRSKGTIETKKYKEVVNLDDAVIPGIYLLKATIGNASKIVKLTVNK